MPYAQGDSEGADTDGGDQPYPASPLGTGPHIRCGRFRA